MIGKALDRGCSVNHSPAAHSFCDPGVDLSIPFQVVSHMILQDIGKNRYSLCNWHGLLHRIHPMRNMGESKTSRKSMFLPTLEDGYFNLILSLKEN